MAIVTQSGLNNLKTEYQKLISERPAAVLDLKKAREMGDLSENGYYKSARWKLSGIDSRIRRLKKTISGATIISKKTSNVVEIGSTVELQSGSDKLSFQIVGSLEANPKEHKISNQSPIGKMLLGKKTRSTILINTKTFEIVKIT